MFPSGVAVGDVFRLGRALVQVSQGGLRNCRGASGIDGRWRGARVREGRTGWYYRVLEPGLGVKASGMRWNWSTARLPTTETAPAGTLYVDRLNQGELEGHRRAGRSGRGLAALYIRRLESGRVEDWSKRLEGSA